MKISKQFPLIVLLSASMLGFAQKPAKSGASATSKPESYTGVISDTACKSKHDMAGMGAKDEPDCVKKCVAQGEKYVLLAGKDVYKLEGTPADFAKYAAQNVTVKGSLQGDTLKATSVTPAKASKPATTKKKTASK